MKNYSILLHEQINEFSIVDIFHNIREHKQAEETLRESEEKLRNFIDFVPDCFTIYDSEIKQRSPMKRYNIFVPFQGTETSGGTVELDELKKKYGM